MSLADVVSHFVCVPSAEQWFYFSPWSLAYLVLGSVSPEQCQEWVPSYRADLKSI